MYSNELPIIFTELVIQFIEWLSHLSLLWARFECQLSNNYYNVINIYKCLYNVFLIITIIIHLLYVSITKRSIILAHACGRTSI